jgi:hypothetical protein
MTDQERLKDLISLIESKSIYEFDTAKEALMCIANNYDFTPKFKKLEWGITGNIQENCYSINEKYYITFDNEDKIYSAFRISAANFTDLGSNTNLQKCKDLCQTDYEQGVLNNII